MRIKISKKLKIAIGSLLIATAIGITVFECLGNKSDNGEKTLTVYYVKDTAYFEDALSSYKELNTKIVLNMVAFETEEELSERLATDMATGTGADVILLSDSTTLDVYKSCKGDNFADLSSYFSKDENYTDDKYFKNIIENMKTDGKQYIVPFTFNFTAYGMKKSVADKLQIEKIDSSMNYTDFMKDVLSYQKQLAGMETDGGSTVTSIGYGSGATMGSMGQMMRSMGINMIDENGNISITKSEFQSISSVLKEIVDQLAKNSQSSNTTVTGLVKTGLDSSYFYNGPVPVFFPILSSMLDSNYIDSLIFTGVPSTGEVNGYNASIKAFGVANNASKFKKEDYQLLKYLMDYNYKIDFWADFGMSVNKKEFNDIYYELQHGNKKYDFSGGNVFKTAPWSEETKGYYDNLVNNIVTSSLPNIQVENIVWENMKDYFMGTEEFDKCYDKMISQLKLYTQE